jgi:hypothetical protein
MDNVGSMVLRAGRPVAEATLDDDMQAIERMLAEHEAGSEQQHQEGAGGSTVQVGPPRPGSRASFSSAAARSDHHGQGHGHTNGGYTAVGHTTESDQLVILDPHPPTGSRASNASRGRVQYGSPQPTAAHHQHLPPAHQDTSGQLSSHHHHTHQHMQATATHSNSLGHTGMPLQYSGSGA